MDKDIEVALKRMVGVSADRAMDAERTRHRRILNLLNQKKIPEEGWDELSLQKLLDFIAALDSNNFLDQVGAGEREGRLLCPLVARSHFHMSHGVGRSGNIAECQPKAVGSSVLNRLATSMALDVIRLSGIPSCRSALVVPLSTGMSLLLILLQLRQLKPNAVWVIWSRMDQKSALKAIVTAGLRVLIVEPKCDGMQLITDLEAIEEQLKEHSSNILCVLSTTSCFAPRCPDALIEIGRLTRQYKIFHIVNNAYGLQSEQCTALLQKAGHESLVDVFVQSTDKNFCVPVGGAIIAGFNEQLIESIGQAYPGRGSGMAVRDLILTLLWTGIAGYTRMLNERRRLHSLMKDRLQALAIEFGEQLMTVPNNDISFAITLNGIDKEQVGQFGAHLFLQHVTGARVVVANDEITTVCNEQLINWCAHSSKTDNIYVNVACAIGMKEREMELVVDRLRNTFNKFNKLTTKR